MVEGELKKRVHSAYANFYRGKTSFGNQKIDEIIDEAKKDIFKELKIKKLRFKHSKDGWDWTEEDVPKLLDKLEKWFGDSS